MRRRSTDISCCFFFNDTPPTEIYTLSLHDALPISEQDDGDQPGDRQGKLRQEHLSRVRPIAPSGGPSVWSRRSLDRKSTRLNSSHSSISYAVFCLKKKNEIETRDLGAAHLSAA